MAKAAGLHFSQCVHRVQRKRLTQVRAPYRIGEGFHPMGMDAEARFLRDGFKLGLEPCGQFQAGGFGNLGSGHVKLGYLVVKYNDLINPTQDENNEYIIDIHLEKNMAMTAPTITNAPSRLVPWGTSLGLRITKAIAKAAGVEANTQVRITAQPGRIVIESVAARPSLDDMLARFDPERHGGEVMAFAPIGKEVL